MEAILANPSLIRGIIRSNPSNLMPKRVGEIAADIVHSLERKTVALNLSVASDKVSESVQNTVEEMFHAGKWRASNKEAPADDPAIDQELPNKAMTDLRKAWPPHRRVTGTTDPSAPMPYNPEDPKDLRLDWTIEQAVKHINEEFEKQHGIPRACVLDDESRADIKKLIEEIMKGQPWQVLDEYGTGGKMPREPYTPEELRHHREFVRSLKQRIENREKHIKKVSEELADAHSKIEYLAKEAEKLQEKNLFREGELETQNNEVLRLRREVAALKGSTKEAPTINEEPPCFNMPWTQSGRVVLRDGVTVAVAYDEVQAERIVNAHNTTLHEVSKR